MLSQKKIELLCKERGIFPTKSRGQNFLIDGNIINKIAAALGLSGEEIVLEVGPGLGVLTVELAKQAKRVVAVEVDRRLADFLRVEFAGRKNVEIVSGDILKTNPAELGLKKFGYQVAANLPYNITSNFLRDFLSSPYRPAKMTLMIQKEVAQRIVAGPGEMSVLAVAVQFYSEPEILFAVGKSCFWPKPEVDSAVIRLTLKKKLPAIDEKKFFRTVKIGFSAKRKQLHNNLAAGFKISNIKSKEILVSLGLDEKIRAEDLSVEEWVRLAGFNF